MSQNKLLLQKGRWQEELEALEDKDSAAADHLRERIQQVRYSLGEVSSPETDEYRARQFAARDTTDDNAAG